MESTFCREHILTFCSFLRAVSWSTRSATAWICASASSAQTLALLRKGLSRVFPRSLTSVVSHPCSPPLSGECMPVASAISSSIETGLEGCRKAPESKRFIVRCHDGVTDGPHEFTIYFSCVVKMSEEDSSQNLRFNE